MVSRKDLMNQISVQEGYQERLKDMTGKKKVKQTIRNHRIRKVSLVMACICCLFVAVSNPTVQAQMPEWMRWSFYMNRNYEKDFAEYEKEFNETLVNEDGYKLHIYKINQSKSTLAVEYQLEDPNGNIMYEELAANNFSEAFARGSGGGGGTIESTTLDNGHQRSVFHWWGGNDFDFTQVEGETQIASFGFPHYNLEEGLLDSIYFPDMEFVMDEVYGGKSFTYDEPIQLGEHTLYLDELSYEGGVLILSAIKSNGISMDNIYFEVKVEGEIIHWMAKGGSVKVKSEDPVWENYRMYREVYKLDMQSGDEISLVPTLVVSEKNGEYIRGEEIKVKFDK